MSRLMQCYRTRRTFKHHAHIRMQFIQATGVQRRKDVRKWGLCRPLQLALGPGSVERPATLPEASEKPPRLKTASHCSSRCARSCSEAPPSQHLDPLRIHLSQSSETVHVMHVQHALYGPGSPSAVNPLAPLGG